MLLVSTSAQSVLGDGDQGPGVNVRAGEQEFVSPGTAARMITRTTRTIARLAKTGELTPHWPEGGRYMFFRRSEVEEYLRRRREETMSRL